MSKDNRHEIVLVPVMHISNMQPKPIQRELQRLEHFSIRAFNLINKTESISVAPESVSNDI